jgi:hypothetical protein
MTLFDLIFILVVLGTAMALVHALYLTVRGRRAAALQALKRLGLALGTYLGVVVLVSLLSPGRVLALNEDQCSDDWCLAVEDVSLAKTLGSASSPARANGTFYVVRLRVSSRARRVTQRENGVSAYLIDDRATPYPPSASGQQAYESANGVTRSLSDPIGPGASFRTTRVFDIPDRAHGLGLVLKHAGPGPLIIGDSQSLFHKPTVVRLGRD